MHRIPLYLGLVLLSLCAHGFALQRVAAQAVEGADDPRVLEARRHFDAADEHYQADRFALAAREYQRAYDLLAEANHPRAGLVLFNVGRSEIQIRGHEAQAQRAFEGFLQATPDNADNRENIQRARAYLEDLNARGGAGGADPGASDASGSGGGISPIGPIVLGVGGATLLAGVIVGAASLVQAGELQDMCADLTRCSPDLQPRYDEMRAFSAAADVMLIAGGVIAAAGLVLTLVLTEDEPSGESASLGCGLTGCQLEVRTSF